MLIVSKPLKSLLLLETLWVSIVNSPRMNGIMLKSLIREKIYE